MLGLVIRLRVQNLSAIGWEMVELLYKTFCFTLLQKCVIPYIITIIISGKWLLEIAKQSKNVAQRAYKQCLPTNNAKTIVVTLNFNIQSKHAHNFWWCLCSFTGFNNITFLNATSFLTFVKEVFRLVAQGSLWQNECFVTKWLQG